MPPFFVWGHIMRQQGLWNCRTLFVRIYILWPTVEKNIRDKNCFHLIIIPAITFVCHSSKDFTAVNLETLSVTNLPTYEEALEKERSISVLSQASWFVRMETFWIFVIASQVLMVLVCCILAKCFTSYTKTVFRAQERREQVAQNARLSVSKRLRDSRN